MFLRQDGSGVERRDGSNGWVVAGIYYRNAAAKFWSTVFDEMLDGAGGSAELELSFSSAMPCRRNLLKPGRLEPGDVEKLMRHGLGSVLRELTAEVELLGLPPPVEYWYRSAAGRKVHGTVPAEILDAETAMYMLVWLLEWGNVPAANWDPLRVEDGAFSAEDPQRSGRLECRLLCSEALLSEGLVRRRIAVRVARPGEDGCT